MFSVKKAAVVLAVGAFVAAPAAALASGGSDTGATGLGISPGNAQYQAGGVDAPFGFGFIAQDRTSPHGQFVFTRSNGSFEATVTCYTQSGNQAAFSGPITHGTGIFAGNIGQSAYFGVKGKDATSPAGIQVDLGSQYSGSCPIFPGVPGQPGVYPYQVSAGTVLVDQR